MRAERLHGLVERFFGFAVVFWLARAAVDSLVGDAAAGHKEMIEAGKMAALWLVWAGGDRLIARHGRRAAERIGR